MSRTDIVTAAVLATVALAVAPAPASAATNPWLVPPDQFLNMAHQGGELEAPGNTLYAFKSAMRERGADSIEMDSYISADGQLVIGHDATLNGTTNFGTPSAPPPFNEPGASDKIWDYTVAELKKLDDAYWFAPGTGQYDHGRPPGDYELRGVADGTVPPPAGYDADDFRIPTFEEVLAAFPHTRINIELKDQPGFTDKGIAAARELARVLAAQPGGDNENVLVVSFGQPEMVAFHAAMPEHDSLAASLEATSGYALEGKPIEPSPEALQPPDTYDVDGTLIDAPAFLEAIAEQRGDDYAIHVWGANGTTEDDALYQHMLDVGVQGFMAMEPSKLTAFLCAKDVPRPDGSSHCKPNPGMAGIAPVLAASPPEPKRVEIRAGKRVVVRVGVANVGNQDLHGTLACATTKGKARRWVKPGRCGNRHQVVPGEPEVARIPIRAKRRAHGRYEVAVELTSDDGGSVERGLTVRVAGKRGHR